MSRRPLRSDAARAVANLAIDLGDPGRMQRARRMFRTGAVAETEVDAGRITSFVFGSRKQPYRVLVELPNPAHVSAAVPEADDVLTFCTCPDSADVCKHALAVLLRFAEGIEAKPHLLSEWTGISIDSADGPTTAVPAFLGEGWDPTVDVKTIEPLGAARFELVIDGTDAAPDLRDAVKSIRRELRNR